VVGRRSKTLPGALLLVWLAVLYRQTPPPVNLLEQRENWSRPEKAAGRVAENLSLSATCECSPVSSSREDICRLQGGKSS
jgi:hypothetical protein